MIALGHSTTPIDVFLDALQSCGVLILADVRTVPRSRHNPQFDQDNLRVGVCMNDELARLRLKSSFCVRRFGLEELLQLFRIRLK